MGYGNPRKPGILEWLLSSPEKNELLGLRNLNFDLITVL